MDMNIIEVEIIFESGRVGVYEVGDVFEHTSKSGYFLAMMRLKDSKYGFIPMDIIKSYRILEEEA